MDKTTGHQCPRCNQPSLDIYFEGSADLKLGANCKQCGLTGFFVNGKLVPFAAV